MINQFQAGKRICQAALVRVSKVGNSSNGGVFARGILEDNSGRIAFICFEMALVDKLRGLEGPTALMVTGVVDINKFSNDMQLQVVIQKLGDILPEDDISNLLPQGDFDKKAYETKLQNYIKAIRTPAIRIVLENIFSGEMLEQFLINPAGSKLHHAYCGGLLQHSIDVTDLALAIADKEEKVDKDLIVAGALLHDIGKLKEISSDLGFPYTTEGKLMGHISMSVMLLQEAAFRCKVPMSRLQPLTHVILSHHGEPEKGSPMACVTKEAFIVHYADEINAILNQFAVKPEQDNNSPWVYSKMLQRNIYIEK